MFLLLALALPGLAQDDPLRREILGLDPAALTADELPRLIELQKRVERGGGARDLVEYLVLLRQLAQVQDGRLVELRRGDGAPLTAREELAGGLRRSLDELRGRLGGSAPSAVTPDATPADGPLQLNRELSFLQFDLRVLAQAEDPRVPLLERVRFLGIAAANLDEFHEIRVARLRRSATGRTGAGPDGLTPEQAVDEVARQAQELVARQYRLLQKELIPLLRREGIELVRAEGWSAAEREHLARWFEAEARSRLAIEWTGEGVAVESRGLGLVVEEGGRRGVASVPSDLPPLLRLPGEKARFALLEDVLAAHGKGTPFRVTRNGDLWTPSAELPRGYGTAVRLEVPLGTPEATLSWLEARLELTRGQVFAAEGPLALAGLTALVDQVDRAELKYSPRAASLPPELRGNEGLLAVLARRDLLLHHPFQSFDPVVELVREAARDAEVVAVRQTIYRTGGPDSAVVEALIAAAKAGKDVSAVIELRARFDEPNNLAVAERLRSAGVKVSFGPVGYKCHAKLLQVVRRENGALRTYTHVGTGNYNPKSARIYTDLSYLTSDPQLGREVEQVFRQLRGEAVGPGNGGMTAALLQAPFTLQSTIIEAIDAEAAAAREGKPARIVAKMNSLNDAEIIAALYRASQAGVKIDLVVRGVCTLVPGVPGLSENIRVRSVVGRWLEHSRIYQFHAGGKDVTYIGSADWMERNTTRRVETAVPIRDPALRAELKQVLESYLSDNQQSWELRRDGTYTRVRTSGPARNAQTELAARLAAPPPFAAARLERAPLHWREELRTLDAGLRETRNLGLEVVEGKKATVVAGEDGLVRVSTAALREAHAKAAEAPGSAENRLELRRELLALSVDAAAASALGAAPLSDPRELFRSGEAKRSAAGETAGLERAEKSAAASLGSLARYRRDDLTVDWTRAGREGALKAASGAAKFTLALFLQELAHALATRDPHRLGEFFDAVSTSDFYTQYGLFVAGATAGQLGYDLAYQRYLSPYLRRGFVQQALRGTTALAAGLLVPQLVSGQFEGRTYVISLASLGISSVAVQGAMGKIPWVRQLQTASRAGGWFYQAAELAIVLTVGHHLERYVTGQVERREALGQLEEAARRAMVAAQDPRTSQADLEAALAGYGEAWEAWRLFLYRPLLEAQAAFRGKLEPLLRREKLRDDQITTAARLAERYANLAPSLRALAARRGGETADAELDGIAKRHLGQMDAAFAAVYREGTRSGALIAELPASGPARSEAFGRAHGRASGNRLQSWDDERGGLERLAAALGGRRTLVAARLSALAEQRAADAAVEASARGSLTTNLGGR